MGFTVLTAEVSHETNTFNRRLTTLADFIGRYWLVGEEAISARGSANTEIAGFMDAARAHDWDIIHTLSTAAPPAGVATAEAFETICDAVLAPLRTRLSHIDGIALALHGAMVTELGEDGEGDLLARIRAIAGHNIPIAMTLDPHANVTPLMCELADIIVSFKTYPHVDMRVCARQAGDILHRTMAGGIAPVTLRAHRPMLEEVNGGRTDIGPMIARIATARAAEEHPDVFAVSVNGGFGNADITEVGPTVLVTAQGDLDSHREIAEAIADDIWDRRHAVLNDYLSVQAAAAICAAHPEGGKPIVVADYADNPGGGAYGDATALLSALLAAGVTNACFGPMIDAVAARELCRQEIGAPVSLSLGGKGDPDLGGGPIDVSGTVQTTSNGDYVGDGPILGGLRRSSGPTAVLRVAGIDILVVTNSSQMLDLQQFRAFGIDPQAKTVVALKSMQHFRAAFEPIAARVIVCDSGALCTPDLRRLNYKNAQRPIFPLDEVDFVRERPVTIA